MDASRLGLTQFASPAHPLASGGGFVVCPLGLLPCPGAGVGWVQEVYRRAYEEAKAAVAPTWYDRAALPSRN
jgi:hypothetical protein